MIIDDDDEEEERVGDSEVSRRAREVSDGLMHEGDKYVCNREECGQWHWRVQLSPWSRHDLVRYVR